MVKQRRCPKCKQISEARAWKRAEYSYRPWQYGYKLICPLCGHEARSKQIGEVEFIVGQSPDPELTFRRCPGCGEVMAAKDIKSFKSQYGNYYLRRCPLCRNYGATGEFTEVIYESA